VAFKDNDIEQPNGKRGMLLFTGGSSSVRGNVVMSAFSAGKFGIRALSQSLAKEFGKENIHVGHVRLFIINFYCLDVSHTARSSSFLVHHRRMFV